MLGSRSAASFVMGPKQDQHSKALQTIRLGIGNHNSASSIAGWFSPCEVLKTGGIRDSVLEMCTVLALLLC